MFEFTPSFFANAAIVLLAVVMAACANRRDRLAGVLFASLLLISWLLCLSSWTPWAIEGFYNAATGAGLVKPTDCYAMWALENALIAFLGVCLMWVLEPVEGWSVPWGDALILLLTLGFANDCLRYFGLLGKDPFYHIADALFICEEAVFFVLGGPNVGNWVGRCVDRFRSYYAGSIVFQKARLK